MNRRWIGALAAVAAASLALTACQAIPTSGPVHEGLSDFSAEQPALQFNPVGPQEGSKPEEIVQGFIDAASSPVDDYRVARQFLTSAYSSEWDPSRGVFLYEGSRLLSTGEDAVTTLSLNGLATIDAFGTLKPVEPGAPTEARFELQQVDGQWRISSAPAGIILDRGTFDLLWSQRQIYFPAPDGRMIAEKRWYLTRQATGSTGSQTATLSTQIVNGLLNGPSDGMVGAVRTAFPEGTTLTLGSVPVTNGEARIDLSEEVLTADPATFELIKRQLALSLQSDPRVSRFEIQVGGVAVDHGSVMLPDDVQTDTEHSSTVVLSDGVLGLVTIDGLQELPDIGDRIVDLGPTAIALSADHRTAVVRTAGGVDWVSNDAVVQVDARPGQIEPLIDRSGYVWSYATSAPGQVLVTLPGQTQELLAMPWLEGRTAVATRVSKNGARIAVLVADGEQSEVLVAGVVRDASGKPIGFSETAVPQLRVTGVPLDLDWLDDQRFALLTRSGDSGRITYGSPGGFPSDEGSVANAVTLASGGGLSIALRVLSSEGRLYARQSPGWQRQLENVQLVVKTG